MIFTLIMINGLLGISSASLGVDSSLINIILILAATILIVIPSYLVLNARSKGSNSFASYSSK
tara:strand:+ start:809 stop:997 length:189 start_codon:yes stop_codon:yes gene_type:complete